MRLWLHTASLKGLLLSELYSMGFKNAKGSHHVHIDNEEFYVKWVAMLNKCSMDLMLLITERSFQETKFESGNSFHRTDT